MAGIDKHTLALFHFDGDFKDEMGTVWQNNSCSNATTAKFGTHSLNMSVGNLYLTGASWFSKISGSKPRTVDFWVNVQTSSPSGYLYSFGTASTSLNYALYFVNNNIRTIGVVHHGDDSSVSIPNIQGAWHHIAHVYDGTTEYLFVDGVQYYKNTRSMNTGTSYFMINQSTWDSGKRPGYMDEFRVSDVARWTSNFTPPTRAYSLSSLYKTTDGRVFGMSGDTFAQVSSNWDSLTSTEKKALFTDNGAANIGATEIALMDSDFTVLRLGDSEDSDSFNSSITAIPNAQIVTPKSLVDLEMLDVFKSITTTSTVSGNGSVRVAITKDLTNYLIYDSEWKSINIANIATEGMTPSQISGLTSAEWELLDADEIAFAYCISLTSSSDVAEVDKTEILADIKGEIESKIKGSDYDYSYPTSKSLKVKIYKSGDFKINYPIGESE